MTMNTFSRFTSAISRYLGRTGAPRLEFRAALIDMDGTLYDSMPRHARAWQQMMAEIGIDMPLDEFFRHEGRTGAATIDLLFRRHLGRPATEEDTSRLYHRKTELFAAMPPVDVMAGAPEMTAYLMRAGITRVLVTGSGQNTLLNRLDTDFPGCFPRQLRVTSRDVTKGKPAPDPYLQAMHIVGASPWQCLVVENAPLGVESGARSGAFTVGVTTGPLKAAELEAAGADIVFPSMPEFAAALPLMHQSVLSYLPSV